MNRDGKVGSQLFYTCLIVMVEYMQSLITVGCADKAKGNCWKLLTTETTILRTSATVRCILITYSSICGVVLWTGGSRCRRLLEVATGTRNGLLWSCCIYI